MKARCGLSGFTCPPDASRTTLGLRKSWAPSSFYCVPHTLELAAGHPSQQLIAFPHGDLGAFLRTWSGRKIFSFAWFMHSLPIFGCEAHTAHTMKSMVELALHSLDILWIVKESFKNCSYMWAMIYGQVEQTSGPESLYPPHIYRVKWRIQPLCTLSLWWTR